MKMKNKIKDFIINHLRLIDILLIINYIIMIITNDYSESRLCLTIFIFRCIMEIPITLFNRSIDRREDLTEDQKDFFKIGGRR